MRTRHKQWSNGRDGWTTRIIWFGEGGQRGDNIRLSLEDCEGMISYYPATSDEADHVWAMFKQGSPQVGNREPFVRDLIALLKKKYDSKASDDDCHRDT